MKNTSVFTQVFSVLLLISFLFMLCCQTTAQDKSEDGKEKYKVKIIEVEDGTPKVIEEEFKNKKEMEKFLAKHDKSGVALGDIHIETDGDKENHRIMIVEKNSNGSEDKEIIINQLGGDYGSHWFKGGDHKIIIKKDGKDIKIDGLDFEMPDIKNQLKHLEQWTDKDHVFRFEMHGGRDVTFDADLPESIRQITKKSDKLAITDFSFRSDKETIGSYVISFETEKKNSPTVEVFDEAGKNIFKDNTNKFDGAYEGIVNFSGKSKGHYFVKITSKGETVIKKVYVR